MRRRDVLTVAGSFATGASLTFPSPAIAQGILAVEHLEAREDLARVLAMFRDPATQAILEFVAKRSDLKLTPREAKKEQ